MVHIHTQAVHTAVNSHAHTRAFIEADLQKLLTLGLRSNEKTGRDAQIEDLTTRVLKAYWDTGMATAMLTFSATGFIHPAAALEPKDVKRYIDYGYTPDYIRMQAQQILEASPRWKDVFADFLAEGQALGIDQTELYRLTAERGIEVGQILNSHPYSAKFFNEWARSTDDICVVARCHTVLCPDSVDEITRFLGREFRLLQNLAEKKSAPAAQRYGQFPGYLVTGRIGDAKYVDRLFEVVHDLHKLEPADIAFMERFGEDFPVTIRSVDLIQRARMVYQASPEQSSIQKLYRAIGLRGVNLQEVHIRTMLDAIGGDGESKGAVSPESLKRGVNLDPIMFFAFVATASPLLGTPRDPIDDLNKAAREKDYARFEALLEAVPIAIMEREVALGDLYTIIDNTGTRAARWGHFWISSFGNSEETPLSRLIVKLTESFDEIAKVDQTKLMRWLPMVEPELIAKWADLDPTEAAKAVCSALARGVKSTAADARSSIVSSGERNPMRVPNWIKRKLLPEAFIQALDQHPLFEEIQREAFKIVRNGVLGPTFQKRVEENADEVIEIFRQAINFARGNPYSYIAGALTVGTEKEAEHTSSDLMQKTINRSDSFLLARVEAHNPDVIFIVSADFNDASRRSTFEDSLGSSRFRLVDMPPAHTARPAAINVNQAQRPMVLWAMGRSRHAQTAASRQLMKNVGGLHVDYAWGTSRLLDFARSIQTHLEATDALGSASLENHGMST